MARNCENKQFCNYCKKTGHLISDYTRRPPKRNEQPLKQGQTASALQDQNLPDSASSSSGIVMLMLAPIRELINNSISSAFTSMGVNGQYNFPHTSPAFHSSTSLSAFITPTWFVDLGTSNHITSVGNLRDRQTHNSQELITTANGHHLSIFGIGTLELPSPPLPFAMSTLFPNYLQIYSL